MTTTANDIQHLDPAKVGIQRFCDSLLEFLDTAGHSQYDESVTQLEHGLQCAALADTAGFRPAAQIAALLHDVGHLLLDEHAGHDDFLDADLRHEIVGARLLTRWFGAEVGEPVALHVPAKRYLVAIDPTYTSLLSQSSIRSLEVQGGPMNAKEIVAFEKRPHHKLAVQLRRWDDHGKVAGASTPALEHWRTTIVTLLQS